MPGADERSSAERNDTGPAAADERNLFQQSLPLHDPERGLAKLVENVGDDHPGPSLDLVIEVHKVPFQPRG